LLFIEQHAAGVPLLILFKNDTHKNSAKSGQTIHNKCIDYHQPFFLFFKILMPNDAKQTFKVTMSLHEFLLANDFYI